MGNNVLHVSMDVEIRRVKVGGSCSRDRVVYNIFGGVERELHQIVSYMNHT